MVTRADVLFSRGSPISQGQWLRSFTKEPGGAIALGEQ